MKVSYNWLKEYLDVDISPEELAEKMTFGGIEVESIERIGEQLDQIKVALIEKKDQHPNADHLAVCQVNDGASSLQVICGAPNCEVGKKVALAPVGSKLGDFKIKKVKLRGIESFGMLCSEKELAISEDHKGIMILPENAPLGLNLASYLDLKDTVYEVEITPNRPDLLGMIGVARDIAAMLGKKFQPPKIKLTEGRTDITNFLILENKAPEFCTRYTARMIRGVEIKESPEWLKRYLIAVGLRPINNVVDVTNFVMMEYGHPLHAFDYSLIGDHKILVRRAEDKEFFKALDEETHKLDNNDLLIADNKKGIALAGIIGGENSQISTETKDIVIEAANFLYSTIRKTSGRLGIITDSSYRFERDISNETADEVSRRACQLILDLAGGELLRNKLDSYPVPWKQQIISLRKSRVNQLLRLQLDEKQIIDYLSRLELVFQKREADKLYFSIPHFRKDLTREVDLIEELIRLHGYNNVGSYMKTQNIMNRERFYAKRKLKDILVNYGFSELVNWNFGDPKSLDKLKIDEKDDRRNFAKLKNPLGTSFSIMRSMLLPDLLVNTNFNINHGQKNLKVFEMAKIFTRKDQKLAQEDLHLTALLTGRYNPVYWQEQSRDVDFFDVKGIVESIMGNFDLKQLVFQNSTEPFYQKGIAADVYYRKNKIASLGKIDPKIAAEFEIESPLYILDLDLERIMDLATFSDPEFKDIPKFPPVLRDLSFVVKQSVKLTEIEETIYQTNRAIIKDVILYDQYQGKNIKKGYRSLTFKIIFGSHTKTLTDDYINDIIQKILNKLKQDFGVEMR